MNYLFGSITLILISTLVYFQTVEDTYASFQDWETNPIRYMIENPDGEFFEEAILRKIEIQDDENIIPICNRTILKIFFGLDDDFILIDHSIIEFENISKKIFNYLVNENGRLREYAFSLNEKEMITITSGSLFIDFNSVLATRKLKFFREISKGIKLYYDHLLKQIESNPDILSPHSKVIFEQLSKVVYISKYSAVPPPPPPPPSHISL